MRCTNLRVQTLQQLQCTLFGYKTKGEIVRRSTIIIPLHIMYERIFSARRVRTESVWGLRSRLVRRATWSCSSDTTMRAANVGGDPERRRAATQREKKKKRVLCGTETNLRRSSGFGHNDNCGRSRRRRGYGSTAAADGQKVNSAENLTRN